MSRPNAQEARAEQAAAMQHVEPAYYLRLMKLGLIEGHPFELTAKGFALIEKVQA